ncbi:MAG: ABC transporter ATP-binding protein [Actinomycetota bacterium]
MPAGPAILVERLTKSYGRRRAVDDLSFRVEAGEAFALLGPNGAGKTTTIEILEGYRSPDAGMVRVLGADPRRGAREVKPKIGVMLQEGGLYPGIRVEEAVRLFAAFYPNSGDPGGVLEVTGLTEHRRSVVRRLSGGLKQRLNLALALVGRPQVLFLDEPTAGMDARARADTLATLRALKEGGATIMLTTHLLEEAEALADRVAIIDRGTLAGLGTPGSLGEAGSGLTFRLERAIDPAALTEALGVPVTPLRATSYALESAPTPELLAALAARLADDHVLLVELSSGRGTLAEAFLRLTQPGGGE